MSYCSPNILVKDNYTCFEMDELREIANAFNEYIEKYNKCPTTTEKRRVTCNLKRQIDIVNKTKKQLWYSIYKRLKYICPSEYCWIDLDFIQNIPDTNLREKLQFFTFKPKITRTQNSWLSTQDINNVLQQYQEAGKNYINALQNNEPKSC